jgi:GTP-binding protein Era
LADDVMPGPDEDRPADVPDVDAGVIAAENERLLAEFLSRGDTDAPVIRDELPADHRSGFVAVVGKPNVGKSTLVNALLGEKLAIVSPKPQTTRARQLGILTRPDAQVVFVDTPGIHRARNALGEYMVEVATDVIPDADVTVFLVDVSEPPTRADEAIAGLLAGHREDTHVIMALNKVDLIARAGAEMHAAAYRDLLPGVPTFSISATRGDNRDELLATILDALPPGPRYYPADQLTDMQVRETAAEIVREQILHLYEEEIPHSVAVEVTEFKERSADMTYIAATIYVERESQKAILIGGGGSALKELGKRARKELEPLIGTRVYLDLWVKVLKNWRKDENALRRLGYDEPR